MDCVKIGMRISVIEYLIGRLERKMSLLFLYSIVVGTTLKVSGQSQVVCRLMINNYYILLFSCLKLLN